MITQPYGRLDLSDLKEQSPAEKVVYIARDAAPDPTAPPKPDTQRGGDRRRGDRRQSDRRQSERRAAPRVALECWVEQELGDDLIYLRTGDVSTSGVFFSGVIPYPLGTELCLRVPLPGVDPPLRVRGRVVNLSTDGTGMGVKFTHFHGDSRRQLTRLLQNHR